MGASPLHIVKLEAQGYLPNDIAWEESQGRSMSPFPILIQILIHAGTESPLHSEKKGPAQADVPGIRHFAAYFWRT